MKIVFTVRCTPIPQPRQRHRIFKTRGGKLAVHNYTPADSPVTTFKDRVRCEARRVHRAAPLAGPLAVEMVFVMPRPQSLKGKFRVPHTGRPDCDNLAKSTLDCLKGIAFLDDAQVCELTLSKVVAAAEEAPSVSVSIEQMQPVASVQRVLFA